MAIVDLAFNAWLAQQPALSRSVSDLVRQAFLAGRSAERARELDASGAESAPGFVLVPREPTRAMLDAAHEDLYREGEIDPMLKDIWRAMLAAAQENAP